MIRDIDPLAVGRDALDRHAWQEAYLALSEADQAGGLSGEGLQMLAEAAWWSGRPEEMIETGERAHGAYVKEGNPQAAAMMAFELARQFGMRMNAPMFGGWLARAERHVADDPASPVHGYLQWVHGFMILQMEGDADTAIPYFDRALEIADRTGNRTVHGLSLHAKGWALSKQGKLADGLSLMDEAMVAATGGEMEPTATGMVYCGMIGMCFHRGDIQRAVEWTEATTRWCERYAITGFPGVCRVHRAEIMRLRGAWQDAEEEAQRASVELAKFNLLFGIGDASYEIGEVRRRMGDFAGAEAAFNRAHEYGRDPQPGMSLVRLAQGNLEAAAAGIRRVLADNSEDTLSRVKPLLAQAEIALAAGDLETAVAASAELDEAVEAIGTTFLKAGAGATRGAVLLAQGDSEGAIKAFRQALHGWQVLEAPFEAAQVRVLLGRAFQSIGDGEGSLLELRAALEAFKRLGANHDVVTTEALMGTSAARAFHARVKRAFLFTDIVKSTELVGAIGDEAWDDLLSWHDQLLRSTFAEHGGEVSHQTGDGFFVTFAGVDSAIACAIAIQRTLLDHRRQTGFALAVRIGVHSAEATSRGGQDFGGAEVHKAARIGALAGPSEIVVSEAALVEAKPGIRTSEIREVEVKGIVEPVRVATIEWR